MLLDNWFYNQNNDIRKYLIIPPISQLFHNDFCYICDFYLLLITYNHFAIIRLLAKKFTILETQKLEKLYGFQELINTF